MVRFKDGFEKDLISNQTTVITVDRIPDTKKDELTKVSMIPDKTVDLEKGYYHVIYVLLHFVMEDDTDRKGIRQIWRKIWTRRTQRTWSLMMKWSITGGSFSRKTK